MSDHSKKNKRSDFTELFKIIAKDVSVVLDQNSEEYFQKGGESLQRIYKQTLSGSETSLESLTSSSSIETQTSSSEKDDSEWAAELYSFLDNLVWFRSKESANIEKLNKQLQERLAGKIFADFEREWEKYSPRCTLFGLIVRQLNLNAFRTFTNDKYLPFTPSSLGKELVKTNWRGRNIYHWFVSGLKDKIDLNQAIEQDDLSLLQEINNLMQKSNQKELIEKREAFLRSKPQPVEMLFEIHEVENSHFFQEIYKGLSYAN